MWNVPIPWQPLPPQQPWQGNYSYPTTQSFPTKNFCSRPTPHRNKWYNYNNNFNWLPHQINLIPHKFLLNQCLISTINRPIRSQHWIGHLSHFSYLLYCILATAGILYPCFTRISCVSTGNACSCVTRAPCTVAGITYAAARNQPYVGKSCESALNNWGDCRGRYLRDSWRGNHT